ncbi:MAG: hypothetical protein ABL967_06870 [Bryobacteraceae bacterium]
MVRTSMTLMLVAAGAFAASGEELRTAQPLPELKGEYLSGREAVLPRDAHGKVTLLLLGFSYKSRFAVEEYTKHFRADFDGNAKVTFYEIPMIGGMARLGKWFIDSGMRRGTPKADQENVITVYGGTDVWKKALGVKSEEWAYLVLLDPEGNIAWRQGGLFAETKYKELAARVKQLSEK